MYKELWTLYLDWLLSHAFAGPEGIKKLANRLHLSERTVQAWAARQQRPQQLNQSRLQILQMNPNTWSGKKEGAK